MQAFVTGLIGLVQAFRPFAPYLLVAAGKIYGIEDLTLAGAFLIDPAHASMLAGKVAAIGAVK
jgi:hypothetical protein